jgi:DNA-binding CsgD family transcriptional regulator
MRFESRLALLLPGTEARDSVQSRERASEALTVRERDVLSMISQGLSNKRVARALEISPETVKSHVKSIFLKLAVGTRAEAVFRAGSVGLLPGSEPAPRENTVASSGADRFASPAEHQLSPAEEQPAALRWIFDVCS